MFSNGNEDTPASTIVRTSLGNTYDINNITGAMKKKLIEAGEVSPDTFIVPDNIPGRKLAELRAEINTKQAKSIVKPFKIGDIVVYRKTNCEVLKVHSKKGVKIRTRDGKSSGWLSFSEVKPFANKENVEDAGEE